MLEKINKNKKSILLAIATVLVGMLAGLGFYNENKDVTEEEIINNAINEVVNYIDNQSTTEIPALTENEEQVLEVQETEAEGFEEQGLIAYEGANGTPDVNVGEYAGLTYYNQTDSRWGNNMYSSVGDYSQTIATSGCGPTSAAMVVSSIRGTITPDVMSDLYTQYGYRSANQGTYWSAFKWTSDVFNIDYSECYRLDDAISKLNDNNYIIVSCNQGLFTYGGHFIVIVGIDGDNLKIYDPYLYGGKFDVSSRRGLANVVGNTVYVSKDNFRNYANYQKFFCFKNDRTDIKDNTTDAYISGSTNSVQNVNYKVRITANSGLNIRSGASTAYSRLGGYSKNSIVTIIAENNGWGKTNVGWINLAYTSKNINNDTYNKTTGMYKVTNVSRSSVLNVRIGPGTNYRAKTYKQLTANAKLQNKANGSLYANGYKNGVVFAVTAINGNWGLTASGWVCLDYCTKI